MTIPGACDIAENYACRRLRATADGSISPRL